jgi:hypothetical protein
MRGQWCHECDIRAELEAENERLRAQISEAYMRGHRAALAGLTPLPEGEDRKPAFDEEGDRRGV